ncbi:MAG TPA: DUF6468 domain-containing protein [Sphingobium sp.]|uniref:DUF6468 domain-containing protein n=1 Tax=Sphingobium sp. TaxID=1912891 RepID=UPI002ED4F5B5
MTFVSVTNILLCLLCVGVLVQSARMLRSFRAVRTGDLSETVKQLDRSTDQARQVLSDLRRVLSNEGQASAHALASAESLRDELSLMVGIGNAVAERIAEAAEAAKTVSTKQTVQAEATASTRTRAKRSRGGRSRAQQGSAKPVTAEGLEAKPAPKAKGKAKEIGTEGTDTPLLAAVPVQSSASVTLLPHLSKAA